MNDVPCDGTCVFCAGDPDVTQTTHENPSEQPAPTR